MNNTSITTLQAQINRMQQNNQIQNIIYGSNPKQLLELIQSYPYIFLTLQNMMLSAQLNKEISNILFSQKDGKEKSGETWKLIYDALTEAINMTSNYRMTNIRNSFMQPMNTMQTVQPQFCMPPMFMQMNAGNSVTPPNATSDISQVKDFIRSTLSNSFTVDSLLFMQALTRRKIIIDSHSFNDLLKSALSESICNLPEYQFGAVMSIFCNPQFNTQNQFSMGMMQNPNMGMPPMMGMQMQTW